MIADMRMKQRLEMYGGDFGGLTSSDYSSAGQMHKMGGRKRSKSILQIPVQEVKDVDLSQVYEKNSIYTLTKSQMANIKKKSQK